MENSIGERIKAYEYFQHSTNQNWASFPRFFGNFQDCSNAQFKHVSHGIGRGFIKILTSLFRRTFIEQILVRGLQKETQFWLQVYDFFTSDVIGQNFLLITASQVGKLKAERPSVYSDIPFVHWQL